ncbi:MAG: hypothetical protein OEM81_01735 [Acidimicrobiia bacterium]|nr:hypothetical protein [Acidimicrobiia bacterium]MDH3396531.1 hypothetical protein [Acidimicrobiia bacterium]
MRRLFAAFPGPLPVRVLIVMVALAVVLVALFFLFEWAGDLLDSGGVVGPGQ